MNAPVKLQREAENNGHVVSYSCWNWLLFVLIWAISMLSELDIDRLSTITKKIYLPSLLTPYHRRLMSLILPELNDLWWMIETEQILWQR